MSLDKQKHNMKKSPYNTLQMIDIGSVKWTDGFWKQKFDTCYMMGIPSMNEAIHVKENGAFIENFKVAAGLKEDRFWGTNWSDGDCYKFIEACAAVYAVNKDKELDEMMDLYIDWITKAQEKDGYIGTQVQLGKCPKRWGDVQYHELYNMGHLMTAACVHYNATGKVSFLNIAIKLGDYLVKTFNPTPKHLIHFCYNPSQIMGLVDLYRITKDNRYLELADIFVSNRGKVHDGGDQNQTRTELRQEDEAVGHAVTGAYLYAGAYDLYAETGEKKLKDAVDRIWENMVNKKMYITGGIGAYHSGLSSHDDKVSEAFAGEYELPNRTAYNETCANIANAMLNFRMLNQSGDAKYMDIVERVIYNSMLSGTTLDETRFFYANPLSKFNINKNTHKRQRQDVFINSTDERWFTHYCYCCPTQEIRSIAKIGEWAYGLSDNCVWVHMYGNNTLDTMMPDGSKVKLNQLTNYPWDGSIKIEVIEIPETECSIKIRIPSWADQSKVEVNGISITTELMPGSYVELRRNWSPGDVIDIDLPMEAKVMKANYLLEETRGQVCLMRGPIVYCVESIDLPENVELSEVYFMRDVKMHAEYDKNLLGGVTVLKGKGYKIEEKDNASLYQSFNGDHFQEIPIKMIPYYAWNNRGISEMSVWLPLC